jgi:sugar lactone lactonase YvrE
VFVADATSARVSEYDYRGNPTGSIQLPGATDATSCGKLDVDAEGNLYVAVRSAGRVDVFGPDGRSGPPIPRVALAGFDGCCDVAVDPSGIIYTLSPAGTVVRVFDQTGTLLRSFGSHGPGKAGFSLPSGIDIDAKGRLWVTDTVRRTVKAIRPDGTLIDEFDGMVPGSDGFFMPVDVCIDRGSATLFIVEKNGRRLQAFAIEEGQ